MWSIVFNAFTKCIKNMTKICCNFYKQQVSIPISALQSLNTLEFDPLYWYFRFTDDAVFSSLFIFNTSLVPYQTFEITAVDVEAFSVHNRTYLVFAGEDDSLQVYVHSLQSRQFLPFQTISTDSSKYESSQIYCSILFLSKSISFCNVFISFELGCYFTWLDNVSGQDFDVDSESYRKDTDWFINL